MIKKHGRQEVDFACQSTSSLHTDVVKSQPTLVRVGILKQKMSKETRRRYVHAEQRRWSGDKKKIKNGRLLKRSRRRKRRKKKDKMHNKREK